jgi:hypothetical protein
LSLEIWLTHPKPGDRRVEKSPAESPRRKEAGRAQVQVPLLCSLLVITSCSTTIPATIYPQRMSNKESSKRQCCSTTGNCPCASTSKANHTHTAMANNNETVRLPKKNGASKNGAATANEGIWKVTADERTSLTATQNGGRGGDYGSGGSRSSSRDASPAPSIYDKCDAGPNQQCCRDAVPEERHLISHDIVRDM